MRAIVIGTFVVDGIVAIWLVASLAFGNGRLTAFDAVIIAALLMGFFTSLATMINSEERQGDMQKAESMLLMGAAMFDGLPDEAKQQLRQHFPSGPPPSPPLRAVELRQDAVN